MRTSQIIARNALSNWIGLLSSLLIGFFLMPFVVHKLGDYRYGIWAILLSLTGHLGLFSLGTTNSVVKFISEYRTRKDSTDLNRIVNTSMSLFLLLGILALTTSIVLSLFLEEIFHIQPDHLKTMQCALILTGITVFIGFFSNTFAGILAGSQRYDILNTIRISDGLLRALFTVLALSLDRGIVSLAAIALFGTSLQLVVHFYFAKRENPAIRLSVTHISHKTLKVIFNYGFYMFLLGIAVRLLYYTDNLVIAAFLTASHVTFYAIGVRLIFLLRSVVQGITNVLIPASSTLAANQENIKLQLLLLRSTKYVNYLILPAGLGFIFFGRPFIHLWMGEGYQISSTILLILAISCIPALSQAPGGSIVNGMGKPKINSLIACFEALTNLILSIILVQYYGIIGVALGTFIPQLLLRAFVFPIHACRLIGVSLREYFLRSFRIPLLLSIPYTAILFFLSEFLYPSSWGTFFLEAGVSALFYYMLVLNFGLNDQELEAFPILRRLRFAGSNNLTCKDVPRGL